MRGRPLRTSCAPAPTSRTRHSPKLWAACTASSWGPAGPPRQWSWSPAYWTLAGASRSKPRRSCMPERDPTCLLCRDKEADEELHTVEVWSDDHWRLKVSLLAEVSGFAYLIPRRHIRYVTELDGPEAQTLGPVLARASAALQEA